MNEIRGIATDPGDGGLILSTDGKLIRLYDPRPGPDGTWRCYTADSRPVVLSARMGVATLRPE